MTDVIPHSAAGAEIFWGWDALNATTALFKTKTNALVIISTKLMIINLRANFMRRSISISAAFLAASMGACYQPSHWETRGMAFMIDATNVTTARATTARVSQSISFSRRSTRCCDNSIRSCEAIIVV